MLDYISKKNEEYVIKEENINSVIRKSLEDACFPDVSMSFYYTLRFGGEIIDIVFIRKANDVDIHNGFDSKEEFRACFEQVREALNKNFYTSFQYENDFFDYETTAFAVQFSNF